MKQLKTPVVVERRRRKRILTLRNTGFALLALVLILAGFNIRSEFRDTTGDDFGRLYERELAKAPAVAPAPRAVEADVAAVPEAASADPFSLDGAMREQYLGRTSLTPEPLPENTMVVTYAAPGATESKVKITGGPDGVSLVREERHAPVLGGGFGRQ